MHTHIHTYIHTHTHIYIYIYIYNQLLYFVCMHKYCHPMLVDLPAYSASLHAQELQAVEEFFIGLRVKALEGFGLQAEARASHRAACSFCCAWM